LSLLVLVSKNSAQKTLNYSKTVNRRKQNQHVVVALMHHTKSGMYLVYCSARGDHSSDFHSWHEHSSLQNLRLRGIISWRRKATQDVPHYSGNTRRFKFRHEGRFKFRHDASSSDMMYQAKTVIQDTTLIPSRECLDVTTAAREVPE